MKVVIATGNEGKLAEFKKLAANAEGLELIMLPEGFSVEETGKTFYENALLKARAAAEISGITAVGDDSGLVVEALNGRPGIHSSRYCQGTDEDRRNKLLEELKAVPDGQRHATFVCNMVMCAPDGSVLFSVVRCWLGRIGLSPRGSNGFGYDPIFYLQNKDQTAAELSPDEKNRCSHRGQAFREVIAFLTDSVVSGS
jgi:XTP/dITP diphosphohydrolase